MAFLHENEKKLFLKILYAGAKGSGKTTNLQSIFKQTAPEVNTRFFDVSEFTRPGLFFEFLPLGYGTEQNFDLCLHLFTLPTHDLWPSTLISLMQGVDGIVQVVDSRLEHLEDNEESLKRTQKILKATGRNWPEIPLVFQFNHSDAPTRLPSAVLQSEGGFTRFGARSVSATALNDIGTLDTLQVLTDLILYSMETSTLNVDRLSMGMPL